MSTLGESNQPLKEEKNFVNIGKDDEYEQRFIETQKTNASYLNTALSNHLSSIDNYYANKLENTDLAPVVNHQN